MCRCAWVNLKNPTYVRYHDEEWGQPVHDDHQLYELLLLESFQAGLSWECVLNKREAFREAFEGFDPARIAMFDEYRIIQLLQNPRIIRNRLKICAAVNNARVFLAIQQEFGSFGHYLLSFTEGKCFHESWTLRTTSPVSDTISADLRRRGMRFVGSTIIYSYLQAVGIINGHEPGCFLASRVSI